MERRLRYFLGTLGWTGLLTSVVSTALLERGSVGGLEWFLIFLVSLFAGVVIVEARIVLFASVASVALSSLIAYLLLITPSLLGRAGSPALGSLLAEVALLMVFTSIFPVPVLLCIVGGFIGGGLSERFGLF